MEFLVEFDLHVPDGTSDSEVNLRRNAQTAASSNLARDGHLVRLWRPHGAPGERKAVGLYRADTREQLDALLGALPLNRWMQTVVTPLEPHPSDPAASLSTTRGRTRESTGAMGRGRHDSDTASRNTTQP